MSSVIKKFCHNFCNTGNPHPHPKYARRFKVLKNCKTCKRIQQIFLPFLENGFCRMDSFRKFHIWHIILYMSSYLSHIKRHNFWRSWTFCVFCSIIDYIYHQITCGTTGNVAWKVGEIRPWRCFLYFVSWVLENKFSGT